MLENEKKNWQLIASGHGTFILKVVSPTEGSEQIRVTDDELEDLREFLNSLPK